jgi:hypothetical protein
MNHQAYRTISQAAFLALISLLLTWPPPPTQASPELPPREAPAPAQPPGDDQEDSQPNGAHIVLQVLSVPDGDHGAPEEVQSAPDGVWTMVQWQDSAGGWHDVDGWQGTPDDKDQKTWWLAPDLFGKGPFRWLVYRGVSRGPDRDLNGDRLIATSESFYLPNSPGEKLQFQVSLPE